MPGPRRRGASPRGRKPRQAGRRSIGGQVHDRRRTARGAKPWRGALCDRKVAEREPQEGMAPGNRGRSDAERAWKGSPVEGRTTSPRGDVAQDSIAARRCCTCQLAARRCCTGCQLAERRCCTGRCRRKAALPVAARQPPATVRERGAEPGSCRRGRRSAPTRRGPSACADQTGSGRKPQESRRGARTPRGPRWCRLARRANGPDAAPAGRANRRARTLAVERLVVGPRKGNGARKRLGGTRKRGLSRAPAPLRKAPGAS